MNDAAAGAHRTSEIRIGTRPIGQGRPVYVVAEISGNHGGRFDDALELVRIAGEAGADAVKFQTYTPESLTIDCEKPWFRIAGDGPWAGRTLYDLYREACTPWEWLPELQHAAIDVGLQMFSTPFDEKAVEVLDSLDVPAFKIASFEIVDLELIEAAASKGKPLIISTGAASVREIDEAVAVARSAGSDGVALLHCISAYPAAIEEMNLGTIRAMAETWGVPVGLSDHSLGVAAPVAAVALGATMIEKHLTLSRASGGPDDAFSLEPDEFHVMVGTVREAQAAVGSVRFGSAVEDSATRFRRSLFVVHDMEEGEEFSRENVRSIRPGAGMEPRMLPLVLGRRAARAIERGTPLGWDLIRK